MITPVPGMCFVIEDKRNDLAGRETLKEMGFVQSQAHVQRSGATGTILAVNEETLCPACGSKRSSVGFKPGDRIVFSRYIADQIDMKDENGERIENLLSVPCDGILGFIR